MTPAAEPPVHVAVVGAGRWALAHHVPAVMEHPRARLVALVEPSEERRDVLRAQFDVPVLETTEELISTALADALVVASPAATHHHAALAALEAGLHVLVEKPMTTSSADAWALVDTAASRDRHLMVGFTFQFTHHAQVARALVQSGAIGDIQLVEVSYASAMRHLYESSTEDAGGGSSLDRPAPGTFSDPAMAGGGQAANQLSHAFASMLSTTGLRVETIAAHTRATGAPVDVVDAALLEFTGDAVGTVTSTGNLHRAQESHWLLRYYGTEGVIVHDLRRGTLERHRRDGTVESEPPLAVADRYPARAPARRFVDVILAVGDNPAPGALGAEVVDLVEALYGSASRAGQPVPVVDSTSA